MNKWKPSKAQRREFAKKMQDPEFGAAYHERKRQQAENKRAKSNYDYETAGGWYKTTQYQHDFCRVHQKQFVTLEERQSMNAVITCYLNGDRCHHDHIHVVNEKMRGQ